MYNREKYNVSSEKHNLKEKWSLNTDKTCPRENNLPKLQPFKEYNFINKSNSPKEIMYFETDHISIKPIKRSFNKERAELVKGFFEMKSKE